MGTTARKRGYRSLFWPIILISIGVIWLLANLGIFDARNLLVLLRLWPVLLIAIGLDLLLGRDSAFVGTLIGLGTVALVIVLMLVGPALGLVPETNVQQTTISEPLGNARAADVTLNLSVADVTINALENTDTLIAGDIAYIGTFDFRVEGDQERAVYLGLKEESPSFSLDLAPLGNLFSADGQTELRWNVGLSPAIPLTLDVDGGVGDATLLLDELQLDRLDVNAGVGNVTISLPAGEYRAALDGGVGDFMISIAPGANITLDVNGGVGESTIDVPDDAAVRVETDGGLGDVSVPRGYTQISSRDDDIQVWETDGFAQADETITILYEGGIGGLTIR